MSNIAFNMQIGNMLKTKYSLALSILPLGLMFASMGVTWIISQVVAVSLGIPADAPVKDTPNGMIWATLLLVTFVVLMLAGYLLGWYLNALISRLVFKWNKTKIKQVYQESRVPDSWLKDTQPFIEAERLKMEEWRKKRKQGAFKFTLKSGVLGWGFAMFLVMALVPALLSKQPLESQSLLLQALIWALGGALFGYVLWFFTERQFQKYCNSQTRE